MIWCAKDGVSLSLIPRAHIYLSFIRDVSTPIKSYFIHWIFIRTLWHEYAIYMKRTRLSCELARELSITGYRYTPIHCRVLHNLISHQININMSGVMLNCRRIHNARVSEPMTKISKNAKAFSHRLSIGIMDTVIKRKKKRDEENCATDTRQIHAIAVARPKQNQRARERKSTCW